MGNLIGRFGNQGTGLGREINFGVTSVQILLQL